MSQFQDLVRTCRVDYFWNSLIAYTCNQKYICKLTHISVCEVVLLWLERAHIYLCLAKVVPLITVQVTCSTIVDLARIWCV